MRAQNFGDLFFVDHVDISVVTEKDGNKHTDLYAFLVIVDAATNLVFAYPQKSKLHAETIDGIKECMRVWNIRFKCVVGDSYFDPTLSEGIAFRRFFDYQGMRFIGLGPHTPWPNRAESAVKLFKFHMTTLIHYVQHFAPTEPLLRSYSIRDLTSS